MKWNESNHPRDDDGKFTDKNDTSAHFGTIIPGKGESVDWNTESDKSQKRVPRDALTKKEWAQFYKAIGDIQKGDFVVKVGNKKVIQIGKKMLYVSGTYVNPRVERVKEFNTYEEADNLHSYLWEKYYGKRRH